MVQFVGVLLLIVIVIALPLYWVFEPARQAGAVEAQEEIFVDWGERLFAPTAEGGFNCAGCHGGYAGAGGEAAWNVTDPVTGEVEAVNWKAPALNNIFYRFDEEEVKFILVYGRPFSPMSPWGVAGGGPMNDQQIDTLISYLHSIQIPRENCGVGEDDPQTCPSGNLPADIQGDIDTRAWQLVDDGTYGSYGEALFNLDSEAVRTAAHAVTHQVGAGATQGSPVKVHSVGISPAARLASAFPNEADMISFIKNGSNYGAKYGIQGQGSGRMPGFGAMLTDEQIEAVVDYVRGL